MNEIIFWSLIVCVPFIVIGMCYGFVILDEKKEERSLKDKFEKQSKLENEFLQSLRDKTIFLNPDLTNEQMEQLMIDFNSEPPKIVSPSEIEINDKIVEYHSINGRVYKVTKGKEKWERIK